MANARVDTRSLWQDGPVVGAVGLGCMGMTWAYATDDRSEEPGLVIGHAIDIGVTLIDTADAYGDGTNEEVVGHGIAGRRDEVVLATKGGNVTRTDADGNPQLPTQDGRPEHLRHAIDSSLRRLGVDYVDIYYLHRPDPDVPVEESIGALGEFVSAGKARAIGVCEFTVDQLKRAHRIHPIKTVQSELSLWTREHLDSTLPWCAAHDAAFIPYSPLGRGFLTGAFREAAFAENDYRASNPRFQGQNLKANLAIVDAVETVARRHGATAAQVAIAWTLAQGDHVIPIPGTRRRARLDENAAAARLQLTSQDLAELDALPEPAGSRY